MLAALALTNRTISLILAVAGLICWTLGNLWKKKLLIYIGIGLTVLAIVFFGDFFKTWFGGL